MREDLTLSIYGSSLAAFAMYAGMAEGEPPDPISALQVRLHRWHVRELPGGTEEQLALGIAEELGELAVATIGTAAVDAIGDVLIYAMQLCTASRLDFGTLLRAAFMVQPKAIASYGLSRIARALIKSAHKIRGYDAAKRRHEIAAGVLHICAAMRDEAAALGEDLLEVLESTARVVLERRWRTNPETGTA